MGMVNDVLYKYLQYIRYGGVKVKAFLCPKCMANSWRLVRKVNGRWCHCLVCGNKRRLGKRISSKLVYTKDY